MDLSSFVGFDYRQAILELSHRMTYEQIAKRLGYRHKNTIRNILQGAVPSHVRGEALWALYQEIFGRKPPHSPTQAKGTAKATAATV